VLSGVCGSLLAGELDPLDAGSVGAYLHGVAGELTPPPFSAPDIAAALPAAVRSVLDSATGDTAGRLS
jgi:NAD(P)H-hydrate repair Nnr-like enzyme with NAD(P)H-hydrate dehydratase domain